MNIFLILHNMRSLHNVGSIFRTADGAGVDKIYLTGYTPGPHDIFGKLRKDFAKTAIGAEKYMEWENVKNIGAVLKKLGKSKVQIIALEQARGAISLNRFASKYKKKPTKYNGSALILGNEVRGLSKSILKKSDVIIEIPMHGKKESLNVAVAAGIALFDLTSVKKSVKIVKGGKK